MRSRFQRVGWCFGRDKYSSAVLPVSAVTVVVGLLLACWLETRPSEPSPSMDLAVHGLFLFESSRSEGIPVALPHFGAHYVFFPTSVLHPRYAGDLPDGATAAIELEVLRNPLSDGVYEFRFFARDVVVVGVDRENGVKVIWSDYRSSRIIGLLFLALALTLSVFVRLRRIKR